MRSRRARVLPAASERGREAVEMRAAAEQFMARVRRNIRAERLRPAAITVPREPS